MDILREDENKFLNDAKLYLQQSRCESRFPLRDENLYPCLTDYKEPAGMVDSHYFFQDIYVAEKIASYGIRHIYDIGSRLDGFISHLLSMKIDVTMIDIRPLEYSIQHLSFIRGNATDLCEMADSSIQALSSLHAVEHFGLGRYGDPIDYRGWEKALIQFKRVLAPDAHLFLSVPVGREEKLMFNAHRIFHPATIVDVLQDEMELREFALIHNGVITAHDFSETGSSLDHQTSAVLQEYTERFLGEYDCGIFTFQKGRG